MTGPTAHAAPMDAEMQKFWDDLYAEGPRWSGNPNPVLVEVASTVAPGTALDLGCGEGGDAIWLAHRGWRVTAADISDVVLTRARQTAAAAGVADRIDFVNTDLEVGVPQGGFDLVSAQFLQSPDPASYERTRRQMTAAVAPGGLLLVVSHASAPPWSSEHAHHDFPTPAGEVAALALTAGEWTVERAEIASRPVRAPDGSAATLDDCVVAVRRTNR